VTAELDKFFLQNLQNFQNLWNLRNLQNFLRSSTVTFSAERICRDRAEENSGTEVSSRRKSLEVWNNLFTEYLYFE
jgi:hypothetical protein